MASKLLQLRRFFHYFLHEPVTPAAKIFSGIVAMLIILSVATIPLYGIEDPEVRFLLSAIEMGTVLFFTIEYLLRVWSAAYPFRYMFSWFGIIDFVSIFPFYLSYLGVLEAPHIILSLRILRLLKLGKIYHVERRAMARISKKQHGSFQTIDDEEIERVVHKHPIVFFVSIIPAVICTSLGLLLFLLFGGMIATGAGVLLFALAFLFFFKAWLDFHYDVIYITNHRIILQNRQLFGVRFNDLTYTSITNIRPDTTGFLHFLLGFGDIQIETASNAENQSFSAVPKPGKVVYHISENRKKILEKQKSWMNKL